MKKKILVTGGMGYIGSHTCVELIAAGYEVIIIDNLSNSDVKVLDGIEKITGIRPEFHCFDLICEKITKDFFSKHGDLSGVIHFAAFKAVGESVENPLKYYHNNLVSLMNILHNLQDMNNPLVFSSSCTVYGQPDILPVTEDSPVKPAMSPYGNTKQIAEEMIREYSVSNSQFRAMLLRYFNPIGAHETA
ncbi:MAG: UDP-glucose 4-epimerase GalE, partial [Bacteroidetes bacterium HGW-Bacteroidetes-21]